MGAGDNFLKLEVKTRNQRGIAPNSALVANFGLEWEGDGADCSADSEPASKKMRGALDRYFSKAACPHSQDAEGDAEEGAEAPENADTEKAAKNKAVTANAEKEKEAKQAKEAKEKEQAEKEKAEKEKAEKEKAGNVAGGKLQVGQVLSDGAKVMALLSEEMALLWREEGAGSLSLRAGDAQSTNKKMPPKTLLWKPSVAKCSAEGGMDGMKWCFCSTKPLIFNSASGAFRTLAELVKEKGATSIAKHAPVFPVVASVWCEVCW